MSAKDCLRTKTISAVCDGRKEYPADGILHMPTKRHGWFCSQHCPCCGPSPRISGDRAAEAQDGPVRTG